MPKKVKLEDGTEIEVYTKDDIDEAVSGLKTKNAELMDETKEERRKRQELEQQQQEAETEAKQKQGEYKSLYEKEKEKNEALESKFETFRTETQERDIDSASRVLASQMTTDEGRQKILAKEVRQFAKYDEKNGVLFEIEGKQVDNDGVVGHISTQYPFLVDGNTGSGGGAPGSGDGKGGGATAKATRAQFEEMSPDQRMEFSKEGGVLTD